ncbi:hypothetical protein A7U60_g6049 [Sanghuangporus baumii]|uniref:Uncharacterized protein n=1 Tax=Sanghuangporus baumii TaxID=108892 RepID=A0A9Q5HVP2_SANBA|nr:hypothetical protein A7U60_g6049 [Sanghuangporus baumii]
MMTAIRIDKRAYALSAIESIATLQYYCLAAIAKKSSESCTIFARFPGALSTITQFFVVVLLIMRVYAFYQRKAWTLWVTIPLGTVAIGISAWSLAQVRTINLSFGPQNLFRACVPAELQTRVVFKASWFISGTFDTLIFVLTVYKTWSLCREHRQIGLQSKLSRLLMRDGAMYYGILAITNLVNVVFFLTDENTFFEQSAGSNSVLSHTLTSTLLSRLVLNLREAGAKPESDVTRFSTRLSIVPPEDIMLVPASTFSNSTATRSSDYTWSSSGGGTTVGSSIIKQKTPISIPETSV